MPHSSSSIKPSIYFCLFLLFLLEACQNALISQNGVRSRKAELIKLLDKVPYNELDNYIKVIQDRAGNKKEIQAISFYLLDAALQQTPLDYIVLLEKKNANLGKSNDTIPLNVLGYKGHSFLRMGQTDTALLIIFFIATWVIYRYRQKNLAFLSQNALLRANEQLILQRLTSSQQQLNDFRELILSKNKIIQEIQIQFEEVLKNADVKEREIKNKQRIALLGMKISTEKDWRKYLAYFEKTHPHFIPKIRETLPDISQAELRLIILQYMDFDRAKIAEVLGISADSVRKAEYRLRKKLGVRDGEDLEKFIKL